MGATRRPEAWVLIVLGVLVLFVILPLAMPPVTWELTSEEARRAELETTALVVIGALLIVSGLIVILVNRKQKA